MKAGVAGLAWLLAVGAVPATAGTTAILMRPDGGGITIVLLENGSSDDAKLALSCTPSKDTFGVAVSMPGHDKFPVDGAPVVIKTGSKTFPAVQFAVYEKTNLISGGSKAKAMFRDVLGTDGVNLAFDKDNLTFSFADIKEQVDRFREVCGLR